jgi:hypothetical protein
VIIAFISSLLCTRTPVDRTLTPRDHRSLILIALHTKFQLKGLQNEIALIIYS